MKQTAVWWIRRDIRLHDNPAVQSALQLDAVFLPLFILEPDLLKGAAPKRVAFLFQALRDLDRELKSHGSGLLIRQGPAVRAFKALSETIGDLRIFAQEDFSPFAKQRDQAVQEQHRLTLCPGLTLQHPEAVKKDDGDPYIVFTPYKNKWKEKPLPTPADCLPAPDTLPPFPNDLSSETLPETTPVPDFPATAAAAQARLTQFIQADIQHYRSKRDRMDLEGTSKLSPYLRFGLISAREAFGRAQIALLQAGEDDTRAEIRTWMDELVWREFYVAILHHFPRVMDGPFREAYANLNWRDAPEDLQAWQDGQTGFPVVDAALRQLRETGWMHNRGRMIVASFLTKDLLINWQEGEAWFMAQLVDGDPAANNGGWQWSAGTGTDAAPYFRVFNPVLQGQKFDPDGVYIARWVPELAKLPVKYRHEPWKMKPADGKKYGVEPGKDYPERIVAHQVARKRALDAYKSAREAHQEE
jgi:deoxyribodipyrimidine photo-lyase